MLLEGKVAIVTGAGTGIGKGIAVDLARNGARVVINYRSSETGALDTKSKIESLGSEAIIIKADVLRREQVERMVSQTIERFGKLDILVNNAGIQMNYSLMEYTGDDYDSMIHINVKGYLVCIQSVIANMKKNRYGRIINITSVHSKRPIINDPVYGMTKGALKMLTRECAVELGRYGITVNAVEPGAVDVGIRTGFRKEQQTEEVNSFIQSELFVSKIPVGFTGVPEDIAPVVSFLASDGSRYFNGSAVRVDGGAVLI
jgi:glucose 1-dehydrogenase